MSGGAFWTFTLGFYSSPGVSGALLRWQDEGGADVDVVLYILWRAACGEVLDDAAVWAADAAVAAWREDVVRPLRRVRVALKPSGVEGAQALRERVKADELEAERLEHAILEALACNGTRVAPRGAVASGAADPRPGLDSYANLLDRSGPRWPGSHEVAARLAASLEAGRDEEA